MDFKGGITLIFFCGMSIFTFTNCSKCDINVAVGDLLTIPPPVKSVDKTDEIRWAHKEMLIIKKTKDKLSGVNATDKNLKLNDDGSLTIHNAKLDSGGKYGVQVFTEGGTSRGHAEKEVCVYEKFLKPEVNITCKESENSVVVECQKPGTDVTLTWYKSQVTIKETTTTIKQSFTKDKFKCEWKNPAYSAQSDEVTCSLVGKSEMEDKLFGFDRWIMIAILAGGGGLVLLLMIVLLTCACRSCKRREKHILDEEELRLNFNTPPQRSKHTARGQPAPPVPQEDPEVSNYEVDDPPPKPQSRTKNQQRVRPPPLPIDDGDEQPPPLPQPRKKAPHPKKNQVEESRARPLYMQP